MQDKLKVALIQSDLAWENATENRSRFSKKFDDLPKTDLIVLPEMFNSGFTMDPQNVDESMSGKTVAWLRDEAGRLGAAICGSLVINEDGNYSNRMIFMRPDGIYNIYDKRHTFTLAGEHEVYKRGTNRVSVDYLGWKINLQICYDLRFPVWARNTDDYDLIIYVANWPKARIDAWDTLLKARAIENMAYCIGVNRVGMDANGFEYPGHSALYDPLGKLCSSLEHNKEDQAVYELDKSQIESPREKLKFLSDRDSFSLEV